MVQKEISDAYPEKLGQSLTKSGEIIVISRGSPSVSLCGERNDKDFLYDWSNTAAPPPSLFITMGRRVGGGLLVIILDNNHFAIYVSPFSFMSSDVRFWQTKCSRDVWGLGQGGSQF